MHESIVFTQNHASLLQQMLHLDSLVFHYEERERDHRILLASVENCQFTCLPEGADLFPSRERFQLHHTDATPSLLEISQRNPLGLPFPFCLLLMEPHASFQISVAGEELEAVVQRIRKLWFLLTTERQVRVTSPGKALGLSWVGGRMRVAREETLQEWPTEFRTLELGL